LLKFFGKIAPCLVGLEAWVSKLLGKRPVRLVTVALSNKMARIAWAVMTSGEVYREPRPA
jgi:transposase